MGYPRLVAAVDQLVREGTPATARNVADDVPIALHSVAAMLSHCLKAGWLMRHPSRGYLVTESGRQLIAERVSP